MSPVRRFRDWVFGNQKVTVHRLGTVTVGGDMLKHNLLRVGRYEALVPGLTISDPDSVLPCQRGVDSAQRISGRSSSVHQIERDTP